MRAAERYNLLRCAMSFICLTKFRSAINLPVPRRRASASLLRKTNDGHLQANKGALPIRRTRWLSNAGRSGPNLLVELS
jgi:hypothetical protein